MELNQGFNGEGRGRRPIWYSHSGAGCFRDEKLSDTGWYCDVDCSSTANGLTARLPHGRFIAGYCLSDSGERVYFDEVFDDVDDAKRMAEEHARVIAESKQEYDFKYQAARSLEDKIEAQIKRRTECLLLARINHNREAMREEARELKASTAEWREELKTEFKDVL